MLYERKSFDYINCYEIYNDRLPESPKNKSRLKKIEMSVAKQRQIIHHSSEEEQWKYNVSILKQNNGIHQIEDDKIKRYKNKREPIAK